MTNKEIGEALKARRDIKAFADFIGISVQGLYKRLKSQAMKDSLEGQFWQYVIYWYETAGNTKKRK